MKTPSISNLRRTALTGLAILLSSVFSCTYGAQGIFYSIEKEQKIVNAGGLNKYASMDSMAELNSNYYLASGAALYTRPTSGTTWTATNIGNNTRTVSIYSVNSNTKLWAVAGDQSGNNSLLYSTDGSSWTAQSVGGNNPVNLVPVYDSTGAALYGLIVNTYNSSTGYNTVYFILNLSGNISAAATLTLSGITGVGNPILAATDDGSNIVILNHTNLWIAANGTPTSYTQVTGLDSTTIGQDLTALLYVSSNLYAGTLGGNVVRGTITGTTWTTNSNIVSNASNNSVTIRFMTFFYNTTKGVIMAGSNGTGYSEINGTTFNGTPTATISTSNYNSSVLPTSSVTRFFQASNGTLFLGTMGAGLWTWNSGTSEWSLQ